MNGRVGSDINIGELTCRNASELYRRFATQWNVLCWKYKIHEFTKTKIIDAHEEKYFHSI
jgi:hypothetical protein